MDPLITPTQAEAQILKHLPRLSAETTAISRAVRHILATPLVADRPLPPYDRVMMDGIAFRAADARTQAGRLRIAGLHPAGAPAPASLPPGACWEIMTGAILPPDCDTIIRYEDLTRDGEDAVIDLAHVQPGQYLHVMGSDFPTGAPLVPAGTRLGAREMAVAASIGAVQLPTVAPPRITIITTGDELVPPETTPAPHQIRRSNNVALEAALANWGVTQTHSLHLPDDQAALTEALRTALPCSDLILLCGGISRGKRDFVRPSLEQLLGAPAFHGVAQRPGKPLAFWVGPPPVFALPGNPMAVLACFHRYVLPALAAMSGAPWHRRTVPLAEALQSPIPLASFLPVVLTPDGRAAPVPPANSGDFASSIISKGFIELPVNQDTFPPDTPALYQPWL